MILLKAVGKFLLVVAFLSITGCTTIDTKPFEKFNESLLELDKGTTSTLDVTIPMAESRYRKELVSDMAKGNDALLNELLVIARENDPFFISKPPVFLKAKKFKLGISKTNLVWLEYSKLLLQLSSEELVDDEEFIELSKNLNGSAFDAIQALKEDPGDTSAENAALFSELAIASAKEYLKTKQKENLLNP